MGLIIQIWIGLAIMVICGRAFWLWQIFFANNKCKAGVGIQELAI